MIEMLDHLWLRPFWLVALPLAALAGFFLMRQAGHLGGWERAMDPALMAAMRRLGKVSAGPRSRNWLPAILLALIAVALAGPAVERRDTPAFRNLDGVVIAIDLSPSMTEPQRLLDMLTTARLVAEAAGTRQVALVVYGGDAYLASALTSDARAMGGTISLLTADTMPDAGTRPERALAMAGRVLREAEIILGDVVLLSDGGGIGAPALAEAARLAADGITLSTLHVPSGAADHADPAAMAELARLGGGVAGTLTDPFGVAEAISTRPASRLAATDYALLVLQDRGRYLLLLALLPALILLPGRRTA
ncbi:MAG: VWA domain-containing protein [Pseudomonadota bacterium]